MALLPYLFEELSRPRSLRDEIYGLDLAPGCLTDIFDRPVLRTRRLRELRPWSNLSALTKDVVDATVKSDKEKFQVNLDVQNFTPEEISVKTADRCIIVEGKHEVKEDENQFVSIQFKKRYALPEDCNPESVESRLSSDGVLTVTAPKVVQGKNERVVPISQTGPVRRKAVDAVEETPNGSAENMENAEKTPQKRRKH